MATCALPAPTGYAAGSAAAGTGIYYAAVPGSNSYLNVRTACQTNGASVAMFKTQDDFSNLMAASE